MIKCSDLNHFLYLKSTFICNKGTKYDHNWVIFFNFEEKKQKENLSDLVLPKTR